MHLGCGDGMLTAALHVADTFLVQGLDADAKAVDAARGRIRTAGLYGQLFLSLKDGRVICLGGK